MPTEPMFPETPRLTFLDPLGEMLGAGNGIYEYDFDDVVKLAGHACPTVAGAFLVVIKAMELLYADSPPQRGDLRITVHGSVSEGANGPFSQILTLLTGAASDNGFQGLAGNQVRKGLLRFDDDGANGPAGYTFERLSNGASVTLNYDPSAIAPTPGMGADMQAVLSGTADEIIRKRFREAWRDRVLRILRDGGDCTVSRMV